MAFKKYVFFLKIPKIANLGMPYPHAINLQTLSLESLRDKYYEITDKFDLPTHVSVPREHLIFYDTKGRSITPQWMVENEYTKNIGNEDAATILVSVRGDVHDRRHVQWIERRETFILRYREALYQDSLLLGHFIQNRPKGPLDELPIDLSLFAPGLRNRHHELLVAQQWMIMTDGDNEFIKWRYETYINEKGREKPRYPLLKDISVTNVILQSEQKLINLITGETQIGKSMDINILAWVLCRLGYVCIFVARGKNGDSTIGDMRKCMLKVEGLASRLIDQAAVDVPEALKLSQDDLTAITKTVVVSSTLRDTTKARQQVITKAGMWINGIVIAGLQNHTFVSDIGFAILGCCADNNNVKLAYLTDEDDECVGTYDASGSKVERFQKVTCITDIMTQRLRSYSHSSAKRQHILNILNEHIAEFRNALEVDGNGNVQNGEDEITRLLVEKFQGATLRDLVDADIRITSTGVACLHNSYETEKLMNIVVKPIPRDYHGFGVGRMDMQVQHRLVSEGTLRTMYVDQERRTLRKIMEHTSARAVQTTFYNAHAKNEIKKKVIQYAHGNDIINLKDVLERFSYPVYAGESNASIQARKADVKKKLQKLRTSWYKSRDASKVAEKQVEVMLKEAIQDYEHYPHCNILLAGVHWTQIKDMLAVAKDTAQTYGIQVPLISFVYNSDTNCTFFAHSGNPSFKNVDNDIILERFRDKMTITYDGIHDNLHQWNVTLHNRKNRNVQRFYSLACHICEANGQEKPFLVCVSGTLAGRQAIFKDKTHSKFVTHMYVSFNQLDNAAIIQKVGRITGKDDDLTVRKLYCDEKTWQEVQSALVRYRTYIGFLSKYNGQTLKDAIENADESTKAIFKEITEGSVQFHRVSYSKVMNDTVTNMLPPAYVEELQDYQLNLDVGEYPQWMSIQSCLETNQRSMTPIEIYDYLTMNDLLYNGLGGLTYQGNVLLRLSPRYFVTRGVLTKETIMTTIRAREKRNPVFSYTVDETDDLKIGLAVWKDIHSSQVESIKRLILESQPMSTREIIQTILRRDLLVTYEDKKPDVTTKEQFVCQIKDGQDIETELMKRVASLLIRNTKTFEKVGLNPILWRIVTN